MPGMAAQIQGTEKQLAILKKLANAATVSRRIAQRAQVIMSVTCDPQGYAASSDSRLATNRSGSGARVQLAKLSLRSDSMLASDRCSLVFWERQALN